MTQQVEASHHTGEWWAQRIIIAVIGVALALVAGYYLAQYLVPTPKVGLIDVTTQVSGPLVEAMMQEINYARKADDIKAVVLVVNSPGGGAASGHDIYYQVRKLRAEKPVIASIDVLAASAAYQIAVAANEIFAKPASFIGNVGVIVGLPTPETLSEDFITTGPFKATAFSATSVVQKLDMLYANFRDSVVAERSAAPNPLKLQPDEVATGELWIGLEAEKYGLIDQIGSKMDAIERAAQMVNLENYEVVNVRDEYLASLEDDPLQLTAAQKIYEELAAQPEIDLSTQNSQWPTLYQLYIPLE
jgi:protease-4